MQASVGLSDVIEMTIGEERVTGWVLAINDRAVLIDVVGHDRALVLRHEELALRLATDWKVFRPDLAAV
jgi:hypothetical protein